MPIPGTEGCTKVTAGIDTAHRSHIVAVCDGGLHYAVSKTGGSWSVRTFPIPSNRLEWDPEIAFAGKVVYMAYSRIAVGEGACGSTGLKDIGVFYRTRTLPDGDWSAPTRIGRTVDHLAAFRVDRGTVNAVVRSDMYVGAYYVTQAGASSHRYRVPGASGDASMRIGTDGRARIAYASNGSIRLATFVGTGFAVRTIPGVGGRSPALVLDGRNRSHVVWTHETIGQAACGEGPVPNSKDGTYYSTDGAGGWHTRRLTRLIGETSLQVDAATGRVHLLLSGRKLRYYTKTAAGSWQHITLVASYVGQAVIRLDPTTGTLLVAYVREGEFQADSETGSPSVIYAMTTKGT